ncbi:MAG: phosphotransferase [Candidatus Doudnabacteria bacterium]|nr:phosphotransferase [Candidatus Doudnabacteria bacterium]
MFTKIGQAMPQELGVYKFVRRVFEYQPEKTYDFALYQDEAGHLVLAKMWTGNIKNLDFYWLKNETEIYKALAQTVSKYKNINVSAPSYKGAFHTSNSFILLIDYLVEDRNLQDLSVDDFHSIQLYLHQVGRLIVGTRRVKSRTWWYFVLSGFVNMCVSIIRDPCYSVRYMRAYSALIKVLPQYCKESLVFTHRDIKRENIVMQQGCLYIIDFQLAVFTNKYVEVANTIIHCLEKKRASADFTRALMRRYLREGKESAVYKAFAYYAVLYDQAISRASTTEENRIFLNSIEQS